MCTTSAHDASNSSLFREARRLHSIGNIRVSFELQNLKCDNILYLSTLHVLVCVRACVCVEQPDLTLQVTGIQVFALLTMHYNRFFRLLSETSSNETLGTVYGRTTNVQSQVTTTLVFSHLIKYFQFTQVGYTASRLNSVLFTLVYKVWLDQITNRKPHVSKLRVTEITSSCQRTLDLHKDLHVLEKLSSVSAS